MNSLTFLYHKKMKFKLYMCFYIILEYNNNKMLIYIPDTIISLIYTFLGIYIITILIFGLYGLQYGFRYGYSIKNHNNRTIIDLINTTLAYGFWGVWTAILLPYFTLGYTF